MHSDVEIKIPVNTLKNIEILSLLSSLTSKKSLFSSFVEMKIHLTELI